MDNEFSNYPENFNINGLKELKDFVGTRAQLYALISKNNPLAILDKRQAMVYVDNEAYLIIMQKAQGGMILRLIWKIGANGGEYFIQDNIYRETPKPVSYTYNEFRDKVIEAIRNNDTEELKHLQSIDGRWYEDITQELEPLREFI